MTPTIVTTLELKRRWLTDETTIGELYFNGTFECFILEDFRRAPGEAKVPGKTCIPEGVYFVDVTWSPKFKRDLPLVWNVELPDGRRFVRSSDGKMEFAGIRFHTGNDADDTEGCLLTGRERQVDHVSESTVSFNVFFARLVLSPRPATLTVTLEPS